MPPGSWSLVEEVRLPGYHLDPDSFFPAIRDVHDFELAALDTLQHGLARDTELAGCLVHGYEASPAVSLNRAMRSSVRRMRQGAPGVSCSPGMMPSLSQRCKVEGATTSTTAAFLIDASSPLVEDGPA